MRIRTLALATTLSLLGTTSLVSNALAQKGISLDPQTSWSVKKVNEGTSNAYCAVARRFKQNLILTVAKNAERETSIALDFGRESFAPGQSYKITLDPGAGAQRQFNLTPASSNAFVVRVGNDSKFTSSLAKTGYLRVELNNETYNFNLADIDVGESHLDACLISMVRPAAGDEFVGGGVLPMGASSASNAEINSLKTEKAQLESRLVKLEKENASLQNAVSKTVDINPLPVMDAQSGLVKSLRDEIEILKAQNENLKNLSHLSSTAPEEKQDVSIVALARENQKLKELIEESNNSSNNDEELRLLSDKVSNLEQENLDLTRKLQNAKEQGSNSTDLANQLLALKSENKALRQSLENDNIAQENFQELRDNIAKLEVRNSSLNERVKALAEEKADVVRQLSFYEEENDALKTRLSSNGDDGGLLGQLRKEIQKIESDNAKLLSGKEVEIQLLESEIEDLKTEKARLLSSNENEARDIVKKFEAQSEALRIKNEALKAELINVSKDQASIDILKEKLSSLEEEKVALSNSLESSEAEMKRLGEELAKAEKVSGQKGLLQAEIASLNEKVLLLESRNSDLETKLTNVDEGNEADKSLITSLNLDKENLIKENKKLRSEMLAAVSAQESLNSQISLLQDEKEELKKQLSQMNGSIEDKLASLENEKLELQKQLELQDLSKAQKISELVKEKSALENQLDEQSQTQLGKIEELEATIAKLQAEQNKSSSVISELEASDDEKSIRVSELLKENEALEAKLSDQGNNSQIASLENSVALLKEQNEKLKSEASLNEQELQNSIDELQRENADLKSVVEDLQSKASLIGADDYASLQDENETLKGENKDLKLALTSASDINEVLQKDWQETLQKLETLKIENAKYQSMAMFNSQGSDVDGAANVEIETLKKANADLSEKLKLQQKEFLSLVQEHETLKAKGGVSSASSEDIRKRDETIKSLTTDNKILKQEVSNLKDILDRKENEQYQEVSLQSQKAPVKPAVKPEQIASSEPDDNGAPYASQAEQANENVERMKQRANSALVKEREEISKLVAVEPAAGNLNDDFILDGDEGLTEAQKLERRMKGQLSRAPVVSAPVQMNDVEEELAIVQPSEPVEAEIIEPPSEDFVDTASAEIVQDETDRDVDEMPKVSGFVPNVGIESILRNAGIQVSSDVERVAKFSGPQNAAYQWKSSGNLYGSAQQKPISNDGQFDEYVRDYLTSTESRCTGDFAIIPSATMDQGQVRIDSYEIACVGAGVDSSASVVFFSKDGVFTVLAHEAPTASMASAMEARDKIANTIGRS